MKTFEVDDVWRDYDYDVHQEIWKAVLIERDCPGFLKSLLGFCPQERERYFYSYGIGITWYEGSGSDSYRVLKAEENEDFDLLTMLRNSRLEILRNEL